MSAVPVINISPLINDHGSVDPQARNQVIQEIYQACKNVGFFYVTGHGVKQQAVETLFRDAQKFFSLPLEKKNALSFQNTKSQHTGYVQQQSESTGGGKNIREAMYFGSVESNSASKTGMRSSMLDLPVQDEVPEFGDTVKTYMEQTKNLGFVLMKALAVSLGLHRDDFNDSCSSPLNTLGIFHYPPDPDGVDSWGVGDHTDFGLVTILLQDSIGGLEVEINPGEWVPVKPIPGTFVINLGDCLEVWTKGLYRATRHRVKKSVRGHRYSAAFFFNPDARCVIKPLEIDMTKSMSFKTNVNGVDIPFLFGEYKNYLINKGLQLKED